MSIINHASNQITCKIVYYGPGLSGKTTNLEQVHHRVGPESRGKLISLATEAERTLFFDFFPLNLGRIRHFDMRFHLYTVPGQDYYHASRKLILKGADGVVFVADSQLERLEENLASMRNLRHELAEDGVELRRIPLVLQYNKRDLPNICSVRELEAALNPGGVPCFEAVGSRGIGVFDTLKTVSMMVIESLS